MVFLIIEVALILVTAYTVGCFTSYALRLIIGSRSDQAIGRKPVTQAKNQETPEPTNITSRHLHTMPVAGDRRAPTLPFTTFEGYCKQLRVDTLTIGQRKLLDACFPEFTSEETLKERIQAENKQVRVVITNKGIRNLDTGRMRRYAGGKSLTAGRYHSVCRDATGFDNGTLCFELMSYWSSAAGIWTELVDSTTHVEAASYIRRMHRTDSVANSELPQYWLLIQAVDMDSEFEPTQHRDVAFRAMLPLSVEHIKIPNVLDLRVRSAQNWFVSKFAGTALGGDFSRMIPQLMHPDPGGTEFHDMIGDWLRGVGVQALVYPSARRNCFVKSTNEACIAHDGWNLVDYRGARDGGIVSYKEFEEFWSQHPAGHGWFMRWRQVALQLDCWHDDGTTRRWRVDQAEDNERRRYQAEIDAFKNGRGEINPRWASRKVIV